MTKQYINTIIYSALVIALAITVVKADRLGTINQDWSASYQLAQYSYDARIFGLQNEVSQLKSDTEQWKQAVESRDELIEWHKSQPPDTITETVIETKEVEVTKEVQVEKIVEVYRDLGDFTSWLELTNFLVDDDTDDILFLTAGKDGIIQFNGQCEDYAFQLRNRAKLAGKYLDTEILTWAECYKYRNYLGGDISSLGANDGHYINKAVIGNKVWYIEPQNDNIWHVYNLD